MEWSAINGSYKFVIGEDNYRDEWHKALEHYFKIVRVFNPMKANFPQILELLEAMAELKYEWRGELKEVTKTLKFYRKEKITNSALEITSTIFKALTHTKSINISNGFTSELQKSLEKEYRDDIKRLEDETYSRIATIWNLPNLKREITGSKIMSFEPFSEESIQIFGLHKKDLIKNALIAGAVTGSSFDLAVGGHSLFLGSAIGAMIGGGSVLFGFNRLKKF